MSERKKTNLIKLAVVLGVLIIAGLLYMFGVFDNHEAHVRIINNADDEIYAITVTCSNAIGNTSYFGTSGRNGKVLNYQNDRAPFSYGQKIDFNPQYRKDVVIEDTLRISARIQNISRKGEEAQAASKVTKTGVQVPHAKGKRPVLILTGNKEDGYELTYTGKSVNWLIG
jgi:hypothetical protein